MTNLSPAAQAVKDAACTLAIGGGLRTRVAAALRVAADQFFTDWDGMCCAEHLKSIATELEGQ